MNNFTFRHAEKRDLQEILSVYQRARVFMKENGNSTQWGDNWPPETLIREDIDLQRNYVCLHNDIIVGVFAYMQGKNIDPTYEIIEDGSWIGNSYYGVVHRLASLGTVRGVGKAALDFCYNQCNHLRVDTHENNTVMQNLLEKNGFKRCGIIYVEKDHSPRIAYEKI